LASYCIRIIPATSECLNDRQAVVAWHEYDPNDVHVSLFSSGDDVKVKSVSSWKMNSIYNCHRR